MAPSKRKPKPDDESDEDSATSVPAVDPVLTTTLFASLATAMKEAIAAGTATAITTINTNQSTKSAPKYTSSIDLFDTISFSVDTKEGKYQRGLATKMILSHKPRAVTVANAEWIIDLVKDRSTQYGLDHVTIAD